jgi:molybdate transport system substrate-binding protein
VTGTVTVFAAASLTESFTELGTRFEAAHPGVRVVFNFGPSSGLARQIDGGAPADVFASASERDMDRIVAAGEAAAAPAAFAGNTMQIAVPASNPGGLTGLDDLARPDVKVAVCQQAVPCGAVAAEVFSNAGLRVSPVSLEADVKSVLTKVRLGEVDAGLVYVTDVLSAGNDVRGIEIDPRVNASTSYPITPLAKAPNSATAMAFTDYVLSAEGAALMTAAGFARP